MAKRKKKIARQRESEPIQIMGWEFSKAGLIVAICGVLVAVPLLVWLLIGLGSRFSSAPRVRTVDLHTAINLMGLPANFTQVIHGLLVLAAVLLDAFKQTIRQKLA